jgi:hypothetical protein
MITFTKAQLNQILSALDGQPRNPNTKDAALKAIGRHGERLRLSLDDILVAAAGLLDGRMSAAEWCSQLHEKPASEPEPENEAPAQPESTTADEPADLLIEDTLAAPETESVAQTPAALESEAAIAEVAPAEVTNAQPKAQKLRNGTCPQGVRSTKQALMIAMLRRPEGATVEQIAEAAAWQNHTVRGAMAGALKKKLGLTITSEKTEGAARTYRIAD